MINRDVLFLQILCTNSEFSRLLEIEIKGNILEKMLVFISDLGFLYIHWLVPGVHLHDLVRHLVGLVGLQVELKAASDDTV